MKEKEICPKCGEELEYLPLYNFGDPGLGIREEYMKCPSCDYFVTCEQHERERRS